MPDSINTVIPAPQAPLVDDERNVTTVWRAYFLVLQRRTGGTVGVNSGDQAAGLKAEEAAREAADVALQAAIDAEATIRAEADTAEAQARSAADTSLAGRIQNTTTRLDAEILRATGAEALLVPISQLCAMWSQCDLSFLPTTDPGGGRPWLDGTQLVVGTPLDAFIGIGLEDGTGRWTLESGGVGNDWAWG